MASCTHCVKLQVRTAAPPPSPMDASVDGFCGLVGILADFLSKYLDLNRYDDAPSCIGMRIC